MKFAGILIGAALALTPSLALAEATPAAVWADPRIKTVSYQKDNIISVLGMMGLSTMIEFNPDERIATVTMGDTVAWQAVPDRSGRYLFIKPLNPNAVTNMNVVTSVRVYNFMLHGAPPGNTRQADIKLRFIYPDDVVDAKLMGQAKAMVSQPNLTEALSHRDKLNYDYGYKGNAANKPVTVFDDGVKTFFQFQSANDSPAIFAVKSDFTETLINYRREGNYVVVDKVSPQWTLRNGGVTTCIFNQKALASPQ